MRAGPVQDNHIVDVARGQYDVVTWRQFGEVDPDNDVVWLECASVSFISLNWTRYCDKARDALMYEQRRIDDVDRRREIWHEIQEMVRDAYTHIFFNHADWTIGFRDTVHTSAARPLPRAEPSCSATTRAAPSCTRSGWAEGLKVAGLAPGTRHYWRGGVAVWQSIGSRRRFTGLA